MPGWPHDAIPPASVSCARWDEPAARRVPRPMEAQPFICAACGIRGAADGMCPMCPDSPLLDARLERIQELLEDRDRQRVERRQALLLWVSVAIAMVLVIGCLL